MTLKEIMQNPKFTLNEFEAWLNRQPETTEIKSQYALNQFCKDIVGEVSIGKFHATRHGDQGEIELLPQWAAAVQSLLYGQDNVPVSEILLIPPLIRTFGARDILETDLKLAQREIEALEEILSKC